MSTGGSEIAVSSDDSQPTFEGPEKTLEIDFVPGIYNSDCDEQEAKASHGLRNLSRQALDIMLSQAKCCILSHMSNKFLDAYVLSESSLFVYPYKLLIKTCGTTTLLKLLPQLLAETERMGMSLEWLGYMRKSFSFPRLQVFPHTSFGEEVSYLTKEVGLAGEAHALGPLNGDHWNAFVHDNCNRPMSESTDRNLNIMMYDIDPAVAKLFYKVGPDGKTVQEAEHVTNASGIRDLLPTAQIQAHLFEPCGYSMNGLLFESFYTIHVTPEETCSYVSFETNVRMSDYTSLVKNVLKVFRPQRFTMTMVADEGAIRIMQGHPIQIQYFDVPQMGNSRITSSHINIDGRFSRDSAESKEKKNARPDIKDVSEKSSPIETNKITWRRTARSETTFAEDYCFMMGNWTMRLAAHSNGSSQLRTSARPVFNYKVTGQKRSFDNCKEYGQGIQAFSSKKRLKASAGMHNFNSKIRSQSFS